MEKYNEKNPSNVYENFHGIQWNFPWKFPWNFSWNFPWKFP
jgi:hypothetical protein